MLARMSFRHVSRRWLSCSRQQHSGQAINTAQDIQELLAESTWSVSSLLPKEDAQGSPTITADKLRHLLKLSALPPPKDEAEEQNMLNTLESQLHFVKAIQSIDTTGVEPLRSIRDETAVGRKEAEITLESLREVLNQEDTIGVFHKRIRRRRGQRQKTQDVALDVLGNAEKKVGRYFVVEGGKD